jgi:hypothetical protein
MSKPFLYIHLQGVFVWRGGLTLKTEPRNTGLKPNPETRARPGLLFEELSLHQKRERLHMTEAFFLEADQFDVVNVVAIECHRR